MRLVRGVARLVFDRACQATDTSESPCTDLALVFESRALASPIKLVPGHLRDGRKGDGRD